MVAAGAGAARARQRLIVNAPGRISYLESIRGLAALQVLLLHFLAAFTPEFVFSLPGAAPVAGFVHLSPLYFLYDGYSAVYIFFALSGYVLTRSFERNLARPFAQVPARIVRLGLPAMAAVLVSAAIMLMFGKPNIVAGELTGSAWFAEQWTSRFSVHGNSRSSSRWWCRCGRSASNSMVR